MATPSRQHPATPRGVSGAPRGSPLAAPRIEAESGLIAAQEAEASSAMQRERITRSELDTILRSSGLASPDQAQTVVLESDGSFSVTAAPGAAMAEKLPAGVGDKGSGTG